VNQVKKRYTKIFQLEVETLLKSLKGKIQSDCRAHEEETLPGMLVTIGAEVDEDGCFIWDYQTGDNSYTGGAYGYPHWAVTHLYHRSNCRRLAQDAVSQIIESQTN